MAMNLLALRQTATVIGAANAVGFTLSATLQTHALTDLVGVGSFVLATVRLTSLQNFRQLVQGSLLDNRALLVNGLVFVWGTRLASYLFRRILFIHEDKRLNHFYPAPDEGFFDRKRSNFPLNLLGFWSIQAIWGFVCMLPVTFLNGVNIATSPHLSLSYSTQQTVQFLTKRVPLPGFLLPFMGVTSQVLTALPFIGIAAGIIIEAVADYQKYMYKSDPTHKDHWCDVGLWKYARYPNYFGEMMVWWSIYAAALPVLATQGTMYVILGGISPIFISGLLLGLSGVPLHERNNNKRFGSNAEYQRYKQRTNLLLPWPFGTGSNNGQEEKKQG